MRKLLSMFLIIAFAAITLGCSGEDSSDTNPSESTAKTTIKTSSTDSDGTVIFTDSSTEENVNVYISDIDGNPISGISVEFWDAENYELFISEDPNEEYLPAFEIYPHNSDHRITMYRPGEKGNNEIKKLPFSSDKGQSMNNFLSDIKEERVYIGRFTPEELRDETAENILTVLSFISTATGIDGGFFAGVGLLKDIIDAVYLAFDLEPEYYDVYLHTITTPYWQREIRYIEAVESTTCTDADGDRYYAEGGDCGQIDCDDTDPSIHPDATEIYDGIDNNCDGQIDEECDVEIIELKNDDGSSDYSYDWQGTCIGSSPIGNVPDGYFGFSTYLTPLSYPFYISAVSINFAKANSSGAGFYLHVINEDGVELLPVPMLIPHSEFTGYGWWKKDLSEFNLKINKGSIHISIFESYMAPLNCSIFEFQINGWRVNADNSSSGKSIRIGRGTTALDKELMIRISGYY